MGNSTILQLGQVTSLTGAEQLEAVQAGTSVRVSISQILGTLGTNLAASASYANDMAAAVGGVAVGQFYRNGSVVQVRVS